MDTSSGLSSNSSGQQRLCGSEIDERKRKRMISNRESARRSRLRKQKQLDDLLAQVSYLRKENQQILNSLNITSQHYLNVESDNSILRAQANELSTRLQSLTEIANFITFPAQEEPAYDMDGFVNNTWNCISQTNNGWKPIQHFYAE